MPQLISYRLDGEVALIGLDRPDKRNAISDELVEQLAVAAGRAARQARAAVLFGHGKHFSAGLDLAEHVEKSPLEGLRNSQRWHEVFGSIERGLIPWFCALHGAVIGGGLELAAASHVRVAAGDAFFALPEGQRGIFVGGGGSVRIARLTGVARMTDLMLTGRVLNAAEAERWNLVQYVVDEGEAMDKTLALACSAAGNAELSNYAILNALPRIQDMAGDDGLFFESFIASFTESTPEAKTRLRDFLEKRAAKVRAPDKP